ncbi:fumarylacetoacetate hydrolase family protein [Geodermatophilus ruber]|uniref:2-keto-4-pentenoate hydratase/2-oxohepta-3-ene-1,7-dioic acid hydratase (Catechol pathway) n=1 Tax=Geodermatophilus ruber TaxID=504800 RepID=A0A1I4BZJ6_9ACTN|nr:fumarylacetoacetate hydrolase family protein [Geodermatophilus ruber]SFK73820.1 2-keto-4-pentenoate hydratase/2-oxohepta-3-ene-1,7-dioic acid hydratase (catechol pathway) [Geodermatophilus ruber]
MRLVRFTTSGGPTSIGVLEGEKVVPVALADGDARLLEIAMSRQRPDGIGPAIPVDDVTLLSPLAQPASIRDFITFEDHYANFLRGQTGAVDIPAEWYRTPVFYFTNPAVVHGPDTEIPHPVTDCLDYELEVAVVLGRGGSDVTVEEAPDLIAGYTLFNDFSARDVQKVEMALGLGPSKCKDFAHALGPCLATPDELGGAPGTPRGQVRARVNGREYGGDDLGHMQHSFARLISHASTASRLRPGDVLGSGTAATGCIMELAGLHGGAAYPWLEPGDVVELEAEGIGVLRNTIGPRRG